MKNQQQNKKDSTFKSGTFIELKLFQKSGGKLKLGDKLMKKSDGTLLIYIS